ncbi:alginate export family protein [Novosphingobium sp. 9U]|uniref:alginate export family protein n=1 Tax=Novosphingobium sp. 9U TaxID=2653158 RepID=UPI0012EF621D|nr:alginate export family protein [Novosphingobium sp. 9U]VWX53830.1 Alginate export [Novosphingobium sp. 9U]
MKTVSTLAIAAVALTLTTPAHAKPGDPVKVSDTLTIDPIIEGRLRYEHVDQDDLNLDADAVTMRLRAGAEFKFDHLSLLAEGEGTLAIDNNYNAFPFANPASNQRRPGYSVVPDPQNVELNRLQLAYKVDGSGVTVGRQRINLDDQRWVGSVGWRQNEQTFDAVRGEAKLGPVMLDATYSWSDRTIFGEDAGPRQAYDGSFWFLNGGVKAGPVQLKGFAYLLDFDDPLQVANSSKTFGLRATTVLPLTPKVKLDLTGSYARQSDWKASPRRFSADYAYAEGGVTFSGLRAGGGWELLGSDNGFAVQTPFATLHKFNGWADVFLTTPGQGLQDAWGSLGYTFAKVKAVPGLNAQVTYHQFDSDQGDIEFGTEWDAQLGFKLGQVAILAKYANYQAANTRTSDKEILWLQAEFAL